VKFHQVISKYALKHGMLFTDTRDSVTRQYI